MPTNGTQDYPDAPSHHTHTPQVGAEQPVCSLEEHRDEECNSAQELEARIIEQAADLKRVNAILREQAALLDMTSDAILVRDINDRIVFWNRGAEQTYGWTRHQAIGKAAHRLLGTLSPLSHDEVIKTLFEKGAWIGELLEATADGKRISVSSRQALRRDVNGNPIGILVINRDITHAKKVEKEIRSIPARLIAAQEEERKRIGGELHDSIGQILAALKYQIEALTIMMGKHAYSSEMLRVLEQIIPTLQFSIEETRNIYMGLKPTILYELGVVAALQWFCRDFSRLYPGHHVELQVDVKEEDIPQALKIVIFRITQEALNNVAKHSKAEWVDVILTKRKDKIDLTVADDGRGFDLPAVLSEPFGRSMGLTGMRERTEIMAGTLLIQSQPGKGTQLHASWPAKGQLSLPFPKAGASFLHSRSPKV